MHGFGDDAMAVAAFLFLVVPGTVLVPTMIVLAGYRWYRSRMQRRIAHDPDRSSTNPPGQ